MKLTISTRHATLTIWLCLFATATYAATFDPGSNGSYGPLNPTTTTNLDIPPDGIFHCTTINIPVNVGVSFNRNGLNTPIYLLAQSNIVISGYLRIVGGNTSDSNPGRGGPGGFDGGFGAVQGYAASDGQGPGGGKANGYIAGVFAVPQGANTNIYGNTLLSPLIGGSGGAGTSVGGGGGGGGGAIVIASSTMITINQNNNAWGVENIYANGGNGSSAGNGSNPYGGGSGGAVRLVAPVINGNGRLSVAGSISGNPPGGPGRIRIDTLDRYAWRNLTFDGGVKWTVGAQMYVFPPNNPHLDIVEAAGQSIPVGITNLVSISLPPGTPTNQTVKIQATGFTNDVPVTVAVIPESGASAQYNGTISVSSTNATVGTINVIIPADSFCNLNVWTR